MTTFLAVFFLGLLGLCAIVSSPVPTGWGKRAFLFVVGVALWVGAIILVRTNEEFLLDFLFSDWGLSGALANQVGASLVVYGFGWFFFVAKSLRATRVEIQWGDPRYNLNGPERQWVQDEQKFRPWPSILIWLPVVVLLAGIWFVPARFNHVDLEPTVNLTATVTATNKPMSMPTNTPSATWTATVNATPTNTPTTTPTVTPEPTATMAPTQTPDPSKPALACNGVWLHEEPVAVGNIRTLFELCADGYRFAAHEVDIGWDPIPSGSMTVMPGGGARLEFQMDDGELFVNDQPFADWLAAQGGQ